MSRDDWISQFVSAHSHTISPPIYIKWAAISCLAGALARNVYTRTRGSILYPNIYALFVGSAGVGKTQMVNRVGNLWRQLENRYVASSNLTRASLTDELNDAVVIGKQEDYNSLLLVANELGVLLPQYDMELMASLTDIYDCENYSERKRTRNKIINIPKPQINLIAGCTVSYLQTMLPEVAWEQGFCSRVILVYASNQKVQSLFIEDEEQDNLTLLKELKEFTALHGNFVFTQEAASFIDNWHMTGEAPKPTHPKLLGYNSRRIAHVLKLSQIASISESDELIIDKHHIQRALNWLIEVEAQMEEIFKTMSSGGDSNVMKETYHFACKYFIEQDKAVPANLIMEFLGERVDSYKVKTIIDLMVAAKGLEPTVVKGIQCYKPKLKGVQNAKPY